MTINVFGNSLTSSNDKIDLSQHARKSYIRSNYIETDINHNIDLKNQYKLINIPNPINDKDSVNRIYIDSKIADMIKRNIQNDDYISFLDNDNNEYKLDKYRQKITLTNVSLFNPGAASDCNSGWVYYSEAGDINNIIRCLNTGTPLSWRTGPSVLYENLPYLSFQTHFLFTNTYAEISRFDIYNIIKIDLIINRYSQDNIMGEFSVFYKDSNDVWIELYKIN